jgi:Family of unknown function (DUF6412)
MARAGKRGLRRGRSVDGMLLLGCWVFAALQSPALQSPALHGPALQSPAHGPSAQLVLGLAAVAAALLVVLAAAAVLRLPAPRPAVAGTGLAARARVRRLPRLLDPGAAGRPRPRAPSACPAVVLPVR